MKKKRKHPQYQPQSPRDTENQVPRRLFLIFIFLLPLAICPILYDYSNLMQAVVLESVAAAFTAYMVFRMSGRGELVLPGKLLLIPLTAFLSWSLISISWACNAFDGVAIFLQWVSAFAVLIAAVTLFRDRKSYYGLMKAMFFAGSVVASIGILQYLLGLDVFPQEYPPAATFECRFGIHCDLPSTRARDFLQ